MGAERTERNWPAHDGWPGAENPNEGLAASLKLKKRRPPVSDGREEREEQERRRELEKQEHRRDRWEDRIDYPPVDEGEPERGGS